MKKHGFTIIELVIVIAIIAIISVIAIPYYKNLEDKGKKAVFQTEVRNIQTYQQYYHATNGTYGNTALLSTESEFDKPGSEWQTSGDNNGYCISVGQNLGDNNTKFCYYATTGTESNLPTTCDSSIYIALDELTCNF